MGIEDCNQSIPAEVSFFKDKEITQVMAGCSYTIVLTSKISLITFLLMESYIHLLYSFGANSKGQLGIGNTTNQSTPIEVSFFKNKEIQMKIYSQNFNEKKFNAILSIKDYTNEIEMKRDLVLLKDTFDQWLTTDVSVPSIEKHLMLNLIHLNGKRKKINQNWLILYIHYSMS